MPKTSVKIKKPKIWTDRVRRAWDLPELITVSQWADRSRILGNEAAEPGQWRTDRTPYLRGIMDCASDPMVEEITIMASTQVGKTECLLNICGYGVDQDPGPTLWVGPTEDVVKEFCKERIQPMIRNSPDLFKHIRDDREDISQKGIKFDRMGLYLAWSNSPATLASRPIRRLLLDEIDKYPPFSGKESSPLDLAKERTRTFYNRLTVKASSPTTEQGPIWREYEKSDRRRYQMPCPHCGAYQYFFWAQVKFPKDERDPHKIRFNKLAHYECVSCKGIINDSMKQQMLMKGIWVPEGCTINKEGKIFFEGVILDEMPKSSHVGFWINAIYSPWLTFSEIAAKWVESQADPEKLMNFINSWLAEPWKENLGNKDPDEMERLAAYHEAGIVPDGVKVLVGAVDAQKDHFYFTIRGWGYNQRSWQILSKRVETWADIEKYMINTLYESESEMTGDKKKTFPVRVFTVDSGDGNRTAEVYQFCRKHIGLALAIKGRRTVSNGIPYTITTLDKMPDGTAIKEGLKLYILDTTYFKDKITRLVQNTVEQTAGFGGWFFHKNPSKDYLQQFCAEHKAVTRDRKGRPTQAWVPIKRQNPSHFWDTEVYGLAAAEIIHVPSMQPPAAPPRVYNPNENDEANSQKSNWINKNKDWLRNG